MMVIKSYRKKPIYVKAFQLTPEAVANHLLDGHQLPYGLSMSGEYNLEDRKVIDAWLYIDTLEGKMRASIGDWIIQGVGGELYPCKDEIFKQTYEV